MRKTERGSVRYVQLAHNEWDPVSGRSVPKILYRSPGERARAPADRHRSVTPLPAPPGVTPASPGESSGGRPGRGSGALPGGWAASRLFPFPTPRCHSDPPQPRRHRPQATRSQRAGSTGTPTTDQPGPTRHGAPPRARAPARSSGASSAGARQMFRLLEGTVSDKGPSQGSTARPRSSSRRALLARAARRRAGLR